MRFNFFSFASMASGVRSSSSPATTASVIRFLAWVTCACFFWTHSAASSLSRRVRATSASKFRFTRSCSWRSSRTFSSAALAMLIFSASRRFCATAAVSATNFSLFAHISSSTPARSCSCSTSKLISSRNPSANASSSSSVPALQHNSTVAAMSASCCLTRSCEKPQFNASAVICGSHSAKRPPEGPPVTGGSRNRCKPESANSSRMLW
mmetsp:Transcript_916/g.2220  ORF Transcript_916/g.2220 Transcript_916/m.2220 type:complete len:209 (-) Transcript_916:1772-2398(-)